MNERSEAALAEVSEAEAEGVIAGIYDEIRIYCAVPYVSSLQRHLASMPGVLEFAWAAVRPAFLDGRLPETAWRLVAALPGTRHPPLSAAALRLLGVDGDGVQEIRNICDNFIRVAPINLLFAAALERLLDGARPDGGGAAATWTPPAMLPAMPAMVDPAAAPADVAAVLRQLASEIDGRPFVPGLYRLLARWPGYLAHAATLLEPELKSATARTARVAIAASIVAAADDIVAGLPPLTAAQAPPDDAQARAIRQAIGSYRVTSPEMIVFATRLADALPA